MFDKMGNAGTFLFFACGSLASAVFFFFFLRETKGLAREDQQMLYAPGSKDKVADQEGTPASFKAKEGGVFKHSIGGTTQESDSLLEKKR